MIRDDTASTEKAHSASRQSSDDYQLYTHFLLTFFSCKHTAAIAAHYTHQTNKKLIGHTVTVQVIQTKPLVAYISIGAPVISRH